MWINFDPQRNFSPMLKLAASTHTTRDRSICAGFKIHGHSSHWTTVALYIRWPESVIWDLELIPKLSFIKSDILATVAGIPTGTDVWQGPLPPLRDTLSATQQQQVSTENTLIVISTTIIKVWQIVLVNYFFSYTCIHTYKGHNGGDSFFFIRLKLCLLSTVATLIWPSSRRGAVTWLRNLVASCNKQLWRPLGANNAPVSHRTCDFHSQGTVAVPAATDMSPTFAGKIIVTLGYSKPLLSLRADAQS